MNRQQLLQKLDKAWIEFRESYAGLSDAQLTKPGVMDDWSVKDISCSAVLQLDVLAPRSYHDRSRAPAQQFVADDRRHIEDQIGGKLAGDKTNRRMRSQRHPGKHQGWP